MPNYIFFFGEKNPNGYLSNFYASPFSVDGVQYPTSEHYFMVQKALTFSLPTNTNSEIVQAILLSKTPHGAKKLGRQVKDFKDDVWDVVRFEKMRAGLWEKFSQNPEIRERLLATQDAILIEASPFDKTWGIGMTADRFMSLSEPAKQTLLLERNLLGRTLMSVRNELISS